MTHSTTRRFPLMAAAGLVPFFAMLGLFQLAPMGWVLIHSVNVDGAFSLGHYREILSSAFMRQAFGHSLTIGLWSSLGGLTLATVGAAALRRVGGRLRQFMVAFTNMVGNFSGVPLAFAFIIFLGANGSLTIILREVGLISGFNLYSISGLSVVYTYFQIPLAMLLLFPAFNALDDDWQDAAALLGATPASYWLRIGLPVLAPALVGTFIILLANAMGAYATAYALTSGNANLVTIRIANLVAGDLFLEPNLAAALSVLLVTLLGLVTTINRWLLKRNVHA
ncbi:permease [Desulfobaculum senezii]